jgi:phosphoglucosamine mutase
MRHADASLADLVADLSMYTQKMVNVPLAPGLDWQTHAGLKAASDAVRASLGDRGRVLIRASGTEPKLRLMVEADDEALAEDGVRRLVAVKLA